VQAAVLKDDYYRIGQEALGMRCRTKEGAVDRKDFGATGLEYGLGLKINTVLEEAEELTLILRPFIGHNPESLTSIPHILPISLILLDIFPFLSTYSE
jgi:hypothetical protein